MKSPIIVDNNAYAHLSDEELINFSTHGAEHLKRETLFGSKQSKENREKSTINHKNIGLIVKDSEESDLETYCEILRSCPCPLCNSVSVKINATITVTTVSFLLFTDYQKSLKIACPNCLNKLHNKAMFKTSLLGWWALPWGIVRTFEALILNYKMKFLTVLPEPNELFKNFVASRIDRIKANRNNRDALRAIVQFG
jgi:hypothetical protein